MEIFMLWLALCIIPGAIAGSKGRSFIGFFFLGVIISPLIASIIILCMKSDIKEIEKKAINTGDSKKCPKCAELIKREAVVCRFCGNEEFTKEEQEDMTDKSLLGRIDSIWPEVVEQEDMTDITEQEWGKYGKITPKKPV